MKAIQNTINKDLEVSFEGYTYMFPKSKTPLLVENNLYEHIKGIWNKVFKDIKTSQKQMLKPKRKKTPSYIKQEPESTYSTNDMRVTEAGHQVPTFKGVEGVPTSGTVDKDGIEWYGTGIEEETL